MDNLPDKKAIIKLLTIDDLAERMQISKWTIYKKIAKGEIKGGIKIGRQWRFKPDFVEKLWE
jgi:excisionase family DNA binding protein